MYNDLKKIFIDILQKSAHNQENKENKANITPKNQNKKKNEAKEKTKNNRGLFSPNITEIYKNFEESQLSDIRFSFNRDVNREKNTVIKSSQTDSCNINDTELKKKVKEKKKENNKEKKEENNKENKEENKKPDDTEIIINITLFMKMIFLKLS